MELNDPRLADDETPDEEQQRIAHNMAALRTQLAEFTRHYQPLYEDAIPGIDPASAFLAWVVDVNFGTLFRVLNDRDGDGPDDDEPWKRGGH